MDLIYSVLPYFVCKISKEMPWVASRARQANFPCGCFARGKTTSPSHQLALLIFKLGIRYDPFDYEIALW